MRAALAWLEGPADLDGDGYVEYRKRSSSDKAFDNHCWRDSHDSMLFAGGRQAEPPIATADQQGYAYDARLRTARLLRVVWGDDEKAAQLEEDAAALKERFNRDFWSSSRRHLVLALDGEKRQVDALTSDIGHLLWSGIVDERRARAAARRLLRHDLFSGWGIRSTSASDAGYHPVGVPRWDGLAAQHALVAAGLRRYGFAEEAATVGRRCSTPPPSRTGCPRSSPASPETNRRAGRVPGRAEGAVLGGRRPAARPPYAAPSRRGGRRAPLRAVSPTRYRHSPAARAALPRSRLDAP